MTLYHGRDANDEFVAMVGTCLTDSREGAEAYSLLQGGEGTVYEVTVPDHMVEETELDPHDVDNGNLDAAGDADVAEFEDSVIGVSNSRITAYVLCTQAAVDACEVVATHNSHCSECGESIFAGECFGDCDEDWDW